MLVMRILSSSAGPDPQHKPVMHSVQLYLGKAVVCADAGCLGAPAMVGAVCSASHAEIPSCG